jgi:hypothetical protein
MAVSANFRTNLARQLRPHCCRPAGRAARQQRPHCDGQSFTAESPKRSACATAQRRRLKLRPALRNFVGASFRPECNAVSRQDDGVQLPRDVEHLCAQVGVDAANRRRPDEERLAPALRDDPVPVRPLRSRIDEINALLPVSDSGS